MLNRARRARLSALRCQDKAHRAEMNGRAEVAEQYRATAAEWYAVLRALDAPLAAACEECGVAEGEDCTDECECDTCECNRALDADFDAWEDRA